MPNIDRIKAEYNADPDKTAKKYPELFYYYEGLLGTKVSQSIHPAGIIISPVNLDEEYGVFNKDGERCLTIDMEELHEVGAAKYDFLILSTVQLIRDTTRLIGTHYPKTYEINWKDEDVWKDMLTSPVGIFQFESEFAFRTLKEFKTSSIEEMSLVTAAIRPSGASYRDQLIARIPHKNPSALIDDILKDNLYYLIYQEDVLSFLQQVCGLSGSRADTVRRGIARKKPEILEAAMPEILDGYCSKSDKPREEAVKEVQEFIQVIEDGSSYMFGKNHSYSYCLLGYLCAYYRYHYPLEFMAASLNVFADSEKKTADLMEFMQERNIKVLPPKFGFSGADYTIDKENNAIYKGIASIKYMNASVAEALLELSRNKPNNFMKLLQVIRQTGINSRQLEILIKLDYFSEYGNAKELLVVNGHFDYFKQGTMKTIKKDKIEDATIAELISRFATDKTAKGAESKSWTITDMDGLLQADYERVMQMRIRDFDMKDKASQQMEYLGYIDLTTGKKEDRRRLLVTELYPLKSKKDGSIWGYAAFTRSVGSGKSARLTVRRLTYDLDQFKKGDIIFAEQVHKDAKDYWWLDKYYTEF